MIGPKWLTVKDNHGVRRLDSEVDLVRREVVAALDRGIAVIPVLLPGASVPTRELLPAGMEGLTELQMLELSVRHWEADVHELLGEMVSESEKAE